MFSESSLGTFQQSADNMSSLPTKFSVASRVSSKQQSQLENMKLIIVSILLFAFVGSSLAGTHVAAEYGSCQENEYKGKDHF